MTAVEIGIGEMAKSPCKFDPYLLTSFIITADQFAFGVRMIEQAYKNHIEQLSAHVLSL